ncbi:MraY family glycosyltransferase [Ichthyenterobacterium sp. W332]|uniref:MraY family glycosyltransferase n=1 Tax=Microcosmobacter mediterraneus TaxID=3075607 RepID=A0ABU2YMJ1_9FLAO|nr:MraY family glycosyltransferase [Ichthyenterobacterium sp. W332]MDT0559374.1 MraY family glycosyltransferase [Ichthyenterobacterium sp. W332]
MIQELLSSFNPKEHLEFILIGAFVIAFIISYTTFPTILYVTNKKHLFDEPDDRSVHSAKTPTLGGIGIFFSLVVVITIVGALLNTKILLLLLGALTILFFLGLKDDLTILSARKKFFGQLFAALLLIVFTDTRIIGFSKILDVDILPYWISVIFTLFVYILIVNAYNLIDGVDGLAGSVGLLASLVFVVLFIKAKEYSLATVSVALAGALIAFLRLNFSKKNKIFMGDTGSMIVGFLLAFFTISFIYKAQTDVLTQYHKAAPALALALLFYPLMDTFRVFFIRIFMLKTSPFKPDKNHIHHKFIDNKFSHKSTTVIIIGLNLIIILIAFNCLNMDLNNQILALLAYGSFLYCIPFVVKKYSNKKGEITTNVDVEHNT